MKLMVTWFCILVVPSLASHAQVELPADTLLRRPSDDVDTTADIPKPFERMTASAIDTPRVTGPHKSPGLAMLLSAVLPGAGQVYNESYWKTPIILGFGIYFTSHWLHNNRLYREYRDRYRESLLESPTGNTQFQRFRDFYSDQRDTFAWYFLILYLINVADAYVDASLYSFDVSDDLSIKLLPDARPGLRLQVSF
jgi:hypothetical protein